MSESPRPSVGAFRLANDGAGRASVVETARRTLAASAREQHGTLAEVSHIAALAAERLEKAATGDTAAIVAMLREIQNAGYQAFLRQHGTEPDYQAIGAKTTKRYRTPGGKWR